MVETEILTIERSRRPVQRNERPSALTRQLNQLTLPWVDNVFQEEVGAWGPVYVWLAR